MHPNWEESQFALHAQSASPVPFESLHPSHTLTTLHYPQTTRMAKSTRSKVKRSFRAKKRSEGVYAATEAARLHRLSSKLKVLTTTDKDGDVPLEDDVEQEGWTDEQKGEKCDCDGFFVWLGVVEELGGEVGVESLRALWGVVCAEG